MARPSGISEHKRNKLKELCLDWATKYMEKPEGKEEAVKKEIVLKVLSKAYPTEVSGPDGEAIQAEFIWKQYNSTTVPAPGQPDSTIQTSDGTSSLPTEEQVSQ